METSTNVQPIDPSIETPQSFREVALQIKAVNANLERIDAANARRHAENIKAMSDMQNNTPSRKEFDLLKAEVDKKANDWVELVLKCLGAAVGVSIIGAVVKILIK